MAAFDRRQLPDEASIFLEGKGDFGKGQRRQHEVMLNVAGFGFFRAQKFAPGGQVKKELTHFEGSSGSAASGLNFENLPAADNNLGAFRRFRCSLASCQGEAAAPGDAGQRFSTEAHG